MKEKIKWLSKEKPNENLGTENITEINNGRDQEQNKWPRGNSECREWTIKIIQSEQESKNRLEKKNENVFKKELVLKTTWLKISKSSKRCKSTEIMEVRRKRHGIFQEPHEKICQSNILYAVKISFRKKGVK